MNDVGRWIATVTSGIILLAGMLGNSLVIVYYGVRRKQRKPYTTLIFLLAVVDLCISFFGLLLNWTQWAFMQWFFGSFACRYLFPIDWVLNCMACWLLVGMAFERYLGILYPLQSNFKRIKPTTCISVVCLASCVFCIPYFLMYSVQQFDDNDAVENCWVTQITFSPTWIMVYIAFFMFLKTILPLCAMGYFYARIKRSLERGRKELATCRSLSKRHKEVLRTLKLLVVSYAVFVSPQDVCLTMHLLVVHYYPALYMRLVREPWALNVLIVMNTLCFVNSTVNCLIYAGYIQEFRRFLATLVCCRTTSSSPAHSKQTGSNGNGGKGSRESDGRNNEEYFLTTL